MKLMTVKAFSLKHKVSRQAIYAAIDAGHVIPVKIGGVVFVESTHKYKPKAKKK